MTATPIPRSLNMAHYGDLDLSIIKTMPLGRKGTQTRIVPPSKFEAFLSFVSARLAMGDQGFIVTPAIEENEEQDFLALEKVFKRFTIFFPKYRVAFLHGRMKSNDKAQVMSDFSNGNIHLLISTSVVEVGINILNATIMAIINPERFGLSSLHQLRGRVGRSQKPGFCFLVIDKDLSEEQMKRLRGIEATTDGFEIAELDLKIRGEGNLFGTGQSGRENYRKLADVVRHQKQLLEAREDAKSLMEESSAENREIVSQFDKDVRVVMTI
jgi:ATP-dependent DNA helicase RecG